MPTWSLGNICTINLSMNSCGTDILLRVVAMIMSSPRITCTYVRTYIPISCSTYSNVQYVHVYVIHMLRYTCSLQLRCDIELRVCVRGIKVMAGFGLVHI